MRFIRAITILAVAAALGGTALAASQSQAVVKVRTTSLGKILVAGNNKPLYLFMHDKSAKSTCSADCATFWPPLVTTGSPKAGAGVKASMLGTTKRADGRTQVTYHGHPLYYFSKDNAGGAATGQATNAFGAFWYAVSPTGTKIMSTGGGGYGYR